MNNDNLLIIESLPEGVAGCVCYWALSGITKLARLKAEAPALGLDPKLLPELPTPLAVLFRTMGELFGNARHLVKPLDEGNGYALMEKGKDARGKPVFTTIWSCKLVTGNVLEFDGDIPAGDQEDLEACFGQGLVCLNTDDIGTGWLASTIMPLLGAVRLRPSGGFYFVPARGVPTIKAIRKLLEKTSTNIVGTITAMRTDKDGLEAVMYSFKEECTKYTEELSTEIEGWANAVGQARKVRKSTMQIRLDDACRFEVKIDEIEGILGVKLDFMRVKIDTLKARIAQAMLVADAD